MSTYIQVQWTAAHLDEARAIVSHLLENKYISCGSIIPQVESMYTWKEEVVSEIEVKVLMKTKKKYFILIKEKIEELHSYEIPEILSFPINCGNELYLEWMDKQLSR